MISQPRLAVAALAFVAIFSCLGGCDYMQRPSASITGVRMDQLSATDATMLFDVKVDNPYGVSLPLGDIDYAFASKGQQFLAGKADAAGVIPAGSSKVLEVPVKVNYASLLKVLKDVRPGQTIPYTADLGLSVDTPALGAMRLPMSRQGQLDIPTSTDLLRSVGDYLRDR